MKRTLMLMLLLALDPTGLLAHEVRPAYLELCQTAAADYDVLWKVPGRGEGLRLGVDVRLPERCHQVGEVRSSFVNAAFSERWRVTCAGGLTGGTIHIEGLASTVIDVLVRLERLDGSTQVTRLVPSAPAFVVEAEPRGLDVARTYLALGLEHILTGVDHLLFVSGLLLLVNGLGRLTKTISAFTVSHSVTLSLATLGFVHVPPAPVEAVIALSILLVACEIVRSPPTPMTLAQRQPWLMAFAFGLLHGLGFAGGLSAAGLPAGHIPLALTLFSAGVEIGHFAFVGAVLGLIVVVRRWNLTPPMWAWRMPPYAIGSVAAYWIIQRIAAF